MSSEEEFKAATLAFAKYIGIDIDREPDLIHIARKALTRLPRGWEVCISDEDDSNCIPFFHNEETDESVWNHPEEDKYLQMVIDERRYLEEDRRNDRGRSRRDERDRREIPDSPRHRESYDRYDSNNYDRDDGIRHKSNKDSTNKTKGMGRDDNTSYHSQGFHDSFDEDNNDYDPDEELRKLNSWGGQSSSPVKAKREGGKSSEVPPSDDVMMVDVEDFNDEQSTSFNNNHTSRMDESKHGSGGSHRKVGGNAIFGDHWLEEAEQDHHKNRSDREREKSRERKSPSPSKYDDDDIYRERDRQQDWERFDRKSNDHVGRNSIQRASEKEKFGSSASVKTKADNVDNWGMENGRDRLEEERLAQLDSSRGHHWDSSSKFREQGNHHDSKEKTGWQSSKFANSSNAYDNTASVRDFPSMRNVTTRGDPDVHVTAAGSSSSSDVLQGEVTRLQAQIQDIMTQHSNELREVEFANQSLRSSLQTSEANLQAEKSMRAKAESATRDAQLETEKLRLQIQNMMHTPSAEFETAKRLEIENVTMRLNDEWTQKLKSMQLKHENDLDTERRTVNSLQKDKLELEDTVRDRERQLRVLKEESDNISKQVRESSTSKTMELESALRAKEMELSKVKDEYNSMASRAASAMQQAKVAKAEADSLRAETSSIVSDGHTSHAALMQALQRVQQLETELVRMRSEKEVLQREIDAQYAELRKYQDSSISKEGQQQLSSLELKRSKKHFESELSRLKSRNSELEANNMVLQDQLDKASESEVENTRELQRRLDRGEHETLRLHEKLRESEEKLRDSQAKVASLEREVFAGQDIVFKRDRSIRELNAKIDGMAGQREQLRESLEAEIDSCKSELKAEKEQCAELTRNHQKEVEALKQDVESRLPAIISSVTNNAEAHFNEKLQQELAALKERYSHQTSMLKQELTEMQSSHQETITRLKSRASNDAVEMESLRQKCHHLEAKVKEQQETLQEHFTRRKDDMRMSLANVRNGGYSLVDDSTFNISQSAADSFQNESNYFNSQYHRFNEPHVPSQQAFSAIASQLSEMRSQLDQSLRSRTDGIRRSNNSFRASADKSRNHQEQSVRMEDSHSADNTRKSRAAESFSRVLEKENTIINQNAHHYVLSQPEEAVQMENISTSATTQTTSTERGLGNVRDEYSREELSDQIRNTPPRGRKKKLTTYSPEALFESPVRHGNKTQSSFQSNSAYNDSYLQEYSLNTLTDKHGLSDEQYNSDSSSIVQDGGYHEGYWKAKYLRH